MPYVRRGLRGSSRAGGRIKLSLSGTPIGTETAGQEGGSDRAAWPEVGSDLLAGRSVGVPGACEGHTGDTGLGAGL